MSIGVFMNSKYLFRLSSSLHENVAKKKPLMFFQVWSVAYFINHSGDLPYWYLQTKTFELALSVVSYSANGCACATITYCRRAFSETVGLNDIARSSALPNIFTAPLREQTAPQKPYPTDATCLVCRRTRWHPQIDHRRSDSRWQPTTTACEGSLSCRRCFVACSRTTAQSTHRRRRLAPRRSPLTRSTANRAFAASLCDTWADRHGWSAPQAALDCCYVRRYCES